MAWILPLNFSPMEADSVPDITRGTQWQYEPKWDGFRCLAFRDGKKVELMSKSGQSLTRYFPEVVQMLIATHTKRFVMDGELVIAAGKHIDFDALMQRIHPAANRVKKLSEATPATFIVFDLLASEKKKDLWKSVLEIRRERLEQFADEQFEDISRVRLSPRTSEFAVAKKWFQRMLGPLDGVIGKRLDLPYATGERGDAMVKIKNLRTADCVIGGFRYGSKSKIVGSLLLGLYDEDGLLNHVGFTSGFANVDVQKLTKQLEKLIQPPGFTGKAPGGPSRWSRDGRSAEWNPLKTKLVAEVQYDHFSGHRFRHGTRLLRWRTDKRPSACKIAQVKKESESPVGLLD